MPGSRPKDRLASGRRLWRLNQLGRLRLVDDGAGITSSQAKGVIAAEFERRADPTNERAARA